MIFIIDDDDATRDSLGLLLECEGLESRQFRSCEAFLAAARPSDGDCLILDIHMPGMSGIELLEGLRQRGENPPVIILTGRPTAANIGRARAAGALAVLEKPFKPAKIFELLRLALEERREPAAHPRASIADRGPTKKGSIPRPAASA